MCGCPEDGLCIGCRGYRFEQLKGVAARRADEWADSVAARVTTSQPWPDTPAVYAIAMRKVEDLARDRRLLELLAGELVRWAAKRWNDQRSAPLKV